MSAGRFNDIFVVVSVVSLVLLGLFIVVGSSRSIPKDRQHPWRKTWDMLSQTIINLLGWGASLAAIQHVVGPHF